MAFSRDAQEVATMVRNSLVDTLVAFQEFGPALLFVRFSDSQRNETLASMLTRELFDLEYRSRVAAARMPEFAQALGLWALHEKSVFVPLEQAAALGITQETLLSAASECIDSIRSDGAILDWAVDPTRLINVPEQTDDELGYSVSILGLVVFFSAIDVLLGVKQHAMMGEIFNAVDLAEARYFVEMATGQERTVFTPDETLRRTLGDASLERAFARTRAWSASWTVNKTNR